MSLHAYVKSVDQTTQTPWLQLKEIQAKNNDKEELWHWTILSELF